MRSIGIDLATTATHRAVVANERSRFISPVIKFETRAAALERLQARALEGAKPDEELVVVMEATDINWYPVAVYFCRQAVTVHVPNRFVMCTSFRLGSTRIEESPTHDGRGLLGWQTLPTNDEKGRWKRGVYRGVS